MTNIFIIFSNIFLQPNLPLQTDLPEARMKVAMVLDAKKAAEEVLGFHPQLPYTAASSCAKCPHDQLHLELLSV
jgi:hypothetical protein